MLFSGYIVKKSILHKFNNIDEIVRDRNVGTAAVYFGIYLASGLIISACITGDTLVTYGKWYGLISTIVFYVLGMIFLVCFSKIHDKLTPYSLLEEIENDNAAVGISFGGHIIAIGLILMRATVGDVGTWEHSLITYLIDLSVILLLLPSIRFILDRIIVRNINIIVLTVIYFACFHFSYEGYGYPGYHGYHHHHSHWYFGRHDYAYDTSVRENSVSGSKFSRKGISGGK